MRAKPMPEPYCPHCHGTGWTYEDVWVDDGWSVSGDECICVWEKWNDVVLSEAVRQILETSDEDVLADRYPPLVESVSEDR